MLEASVLLYYQRSDQHEGKRINREEQIRLIMECRKSGLSDYQWCEVNGILPGTFYNWISRLRKSDHTIPDPEVEPATATLVQEVVKLPVVDRENSGNAVEDQNASNLTSSGLTAVEIELGNETIRLYNGADTRLVQHVLQCMGGVAYAW